MGRGSSKAGGGSGSSSGNGGHNITKKEVDKMSRKQLEATARSVLLKSPAYSGLSANEAMRRINALMPSNSDAQLRRAIKRYI